MEEKQIDAIKEIYLEYSTVLNPLIQNYEAVGGDFPIEILNEIRSIFSHLAKCYNDNASKKVIDTNIKKSRNHLKRAVLDGFKYNILAYQRNLSSFESKYNRIMDLADSGQFLNDFWDKRQNCQELFKAAKLKESGSQDVVEAFPSFEQAFNAYYELNDLISKKEKDLSILQSKIETQYIKKDEELQKREAELQKREKKATIWNWVMLAFAVVSLVVGVCGWIIPRPNCSKNEAVSYLVNEI